MHPIYDSPQYPQHIPEAREFLVVLSTHIRTPALIDGHYQSCAANLPPLFLGTNSLLIWTEALNNLADRRLIKTLCNMLRNANPSVAKPVIDHIGILDQLKSKVDVKILSKYVIVIDRKDLRTRLEQLADEDDPVKTILVRGDSKGGRTHTRHLFQELAKERGASPTYLDSNLVANVEEVFTALFLHVGGDSNLPKKSTTPDAWYKAVCMKLAALADQQKKQIWVAMDDLGVDANNTPLLDTTVKDFFDQVVLQMTNPNFSKNFRLMLINYPDATPTKWNSLHWGDVNVKVTDIKSEHIEEIIVEKCGTIGKNMPATDVQIKAEEIINGVDKAIQADPTKSRLALLDKSVSDYLKTIV